MYTNDFHIDAYGSSGEWANGPSIYLNHPFLFLMEHRLRYILLSQFRTLVASVANVPVYSDETAEYVQSKFCPTFSALLKKQPLTCN